MKDYYYILGISKEATPLEIKKAFRKLSLKFHPDKNDGDVFFENRFKDIHDAYEILSNKLAKAKYDFEYSAFIRNKNEGNKKSDENVIPEITHLDVNKSEVSEGDIIKISWKTINAKRVLINCFLGPQELSGNKDFKITESTTNDSVLFVVTAINGFNTTESRIKINYIKSQESKSRKSAEINAKFGKHKIIENKMYDNKYYISFFLLVTISIAFGLYTYFVTSTNVEDNLIAIEEDLATLKEDVYKRNDLLIEKRRPEHLEQAPKIVSPSDLVIKFFQLINNRDIYGAYQLVDHSRWTTFDDFYKGNWNESLHLSISEMVILNPHSTTQYPVIMRIGYIINSSDLENEVVYLDYHIKMIGGLLKIGDITLPSKYEGWYEDDPLYQGKNDNFLKLMNRPFALLQSYYDNFIDKESVVKNLEKYNSTVFIHFDDYQISNMDAINKDIIDFETNDIASYGILLSVYDMVTQKFDEIDVVQVPLKYYITKNDGSRMKFMVNIVAILNKENSLILGIDSNTTFEKMRDEILENVPGD